MNLRKTMVFIPGILLLSGCANHLSEMQCIQTDWHQEGYLDALNNKFQRDLTQAIEDCAKYNIAINTMDYKNGWHAGMVEYCQPNNAYQLGVSGKTFNEICSPKLAKRFDASWRKGLKKYCVADTGYQLGKRGEKMPSFCAHDQLSNFRNAYNSGYSLFVLAENLRIQTKEINTQIDSLNGHIDNLKNDISHIDDSDKELTEHERRMRRIEIENQITLAENKIRGLEQQKGSINMQIRDVENK